MMDALQQLVFYAGQVWRRRWFALAIAYGLAVVGWITVALMPEKYTASGQIYVDTQTILRPLLTGLAVDLNLEGQLQAMKQLLLSRPNLEKVARATDRDVGVKSPLEMEQILNGLEKRTQITSARADLFKISFTDSDAKRARDTVDALMTIFIESNLGSSREDMDAAQHFIDEQIDYYQGQLEQAEQRLADFKQRNINLIPGQATYQQRLDSAKANLAKVEGDLQDVLVERNVLKREIATVPAVIPLGLSTGLGPPTDVEADIAELEGKLTSLRLRYTDRHPDVVAVKRRLEELRATLSAAQDPMNGAQGPGPTGNERLGADGLAVPNPTHAQIQMRLVEKEAEVEKLRKKLSQQREEVTQLESHALSVPQVEAELAKLTRDYDVIKRRYEELLSRRESAKISAERETTGQKVQFRVVDPPKTPASPSWPNRLLLCAAVFFFAIAAGLAFALLLTIIDKTIVTARQIRDTFEDVPMLGIISRVEDRAMRRWRALDLSGFAAASLGIVGSFALVMVLEMQVGLGRLAAITATAGSFEPALRMITEKL